MNYENEYDIEEGYEEFEEEAMNILWKDFEFRCAHKDQKEKMLYEKMVELANDEADRKKEARYGL